MLGKKLQRSSTGNLKTNGLLETLKTSGSKLGLKTQARGLKDRGASLKHSKCSKLFARRLAQLRFLENQPR